MRTSKPIDLKQAVLDVFAINNAANLLLLKHIDQRAWRAGLPGYKQKTIGSIFAHLHNCRLMWLKMTGQRTALPAQLDRRTCTKKQAAQALMRSAAAFSGHIAAGLAREDGRIKGFPLNAVAFACYLTSHEAHHRGQIIMLSRQLGYRLPIEGAYGIWNWSKLLKQVSGTK